MAPCGSSCVLCASAYRSRMFSPLFSDFCFRRLVLGQHESSFLSHRSYIFVPDFIFVLLSPPIRGTWERARATVSLAPPGEGMCLVIVLWQWALRLSAFRNLGMCPRSHYNMTLHSMETCVGLSIQVVVTHSALCYAVLCGGHPPKQGVALWVFVGMDVMWK